MMDAEFMQGVGVVLRVEQDGETKGDGVEETRSLILMGRHIDD